MEDDATLVEDEKKHKRSVSMYAPATYQIAVAMDWERLFRGH